MLRFVRHWLIAREIGALAKMKDFHKTDPERVNRVLHSFAVLRVMNRPNTEDIQAKSSTKNQEQLIHIWELSREQYQKDRFRRPQWHRVMANCNSLYEQLSKTGSRRRENTLLAQASM